MIQYLNLLKDIKEKGTHKPPAREGMPGSLSLFGYQFRHNLQDGFPLLTTKKMYWKGVVTELLWFLKGDTNIKYLVDNGCNIWNEDAYNYYLKVWKNHYKDSITPATHLSLDQFIERVKLGEGKGWYNGYNLGDCGFQYGKVWRDFGAIPSELDSIKVSIPSYSGVDQIANVIKSLKETPESRRHIVTAIDPAHDQDLALYWCHALFQFNCRPLTLSDRQEWLWKNKKASITENVFDEGTEEYKQTEIGLKEVWDRYNVPYYYLDCQLYQRSADAVLGVPFNIASYALLTHIIAKICNMIPGEFIHTFGDVHIYENHMDAVEEQLSREPRELPKLHLADDVDWQSENILMELEPGFTLLENYNPHPAIKAELSTGLKK